MQKRECYFSQIALLIIGVATLLSVPVFLPIYAFVIYALLGLFFGTKAAELGLMYYVVVAVFAIAFVVIPAFSLLLRKRSSERLYLAVRKLCNIILTVFATFAVCCIGGVIGGQPLFLAWQWCDNYGSVPFAMLLFLVPVLVVFFHRISIRLLRHIGNTALVISSLGVARISEVLLDTSQLWGRVCLLFSAFIILWFFEQASRDKEGKLDLLTRIILTVLSSLAAIVTLAIAVRFAYGMMAGGFLWASVNSLIFAVVVLVLFVAYTVKVNRVKK